ncbi:MAG: hypothetical protein JXR10_01945 [Cyclobacteriaceae bacterium]
MKTNLKLLLVLIFSAFVLSRADAQKVAIIGYNTSGPDGYSFVALQDLPAGEVIYFTDENFNTSVGQFEAVYDLGGVESLWSWTAGPSGLAKGCVVTLVENSTNIFTITVSGGCDSGSVVVIETSISFGSSDPLYALSSSSDTDAVSILANVSEIHAVAYTNGAFIDQNLDPTFQYPTLIRVFGNPSIGWNFDFSGDRAAFTSKIELENSFGSYTHSATAITFNSSLFTNLATFPPDNTPPSFTSATSASYQENSTGVAYTATANETVTFTLGTSKDESLFSLANSNEISFSSSPDYETPLDGAEGVDRDNAYVIDVIATDGAGNATTQTVTITVTDVDEIAPTVTGVAVPEEGTYKAGSELLFYVSFSENVTVGGSGGFGYIVLGLESGSANAFYESGSGTSTLVFKYTVQTGEYDSDGVSLGSITFFGGKTLKDAAGNDAILPQSGGSAPNVLIDAVAPAFNSATSTSYQENSTGVAYTATANETVTFTLGSSKDESLFSLANDNEISFINSPDFETPLDGTDGVDRDNAYVIDVIATDGAGNATTQTVTITVTDVDEIAPTVTGVAVPEEGTYKAGSELLFYVLFSENVIVGGSGGFGYIVLGLESGSANAFYESGSGTSTLVFKYTVQTGEYDSDGVSLGSITFFGGKTLKDAAGNDAILPQSGGSAPNVLIDAVAPAFNSATSTSYQENSTGVAYTATANETVTFTLGSSKDESFFSLANDNEISFINSPDYETPADGNTDNSYVIDVIATDGAGNSTTLEVTITVTDVFDIVITFDGLSFSGENYVSTENSNIQFSMNGNFSISNDKLNFSGASYSADDYLRVETVDGSNLDFQSFYVDAQFYSVESVEAYDNGVLLYTFDAPSSGDAAGIISLGDEFDDIDRIDLRASENGFYGSFDNFVFGQAIDNTSPTFTSSTSASFEENGTGVAYTATADETVTFTLGSNKDESLFSLANDNEISFSSSPDYEAPADGNTDNDYLIDVIATDAAGNATTLEVTISVTDIDEIAPTVTIASIATDPTDHNPITVTITFSESVTGFVEGDITVNGGAIQSFAGSGASYSFDLVPSGNGTLTVDIAADVAQDAAGNNNTLAAQFSIEYFVNTAPTFTSAPVTSVDESAEYSYTIETSDVDNHAVTVTATTKPDWLSFTSSFGGEVTTLAGTAGVIGSTDDTDISASFYNPYDVAVDGEGNVYVADRGNHLIRKITPAGVVTTLAGTAGVSGSTDGAGPSASFSQPYGVAVDGSGNVYVADRYNHLIRKITSAGVVTTLAGTAGGSGSIDGTGTSASFSQPFGIAVDGSGNVYVADHANDLIRKITPAGVVTTLAGTVGSPGNADGTGPSASFNGPFGLTVDASGNVYVADRDNGSIRKITSDGVVTTLCVGLGSPRGVTVDGSGNVYVSTAHIIQKVTPEGVVTTLAGSGWTGSTDGTGTSADFNTPYGLAVDGSSNVYVADRYNHTIRKVTTPGTVLSGTAPATPADYPVVLNANDGNGGITEQSFTVAVNDFTDPVFNSGSSVDYAENGTGVAYTATANEQVTFTLGSSKDESLFTLANGNEISFNSSPDYETPADGNTDNSYVIDVIATDGAGNATTLEVTITVTDVAENIAPVVDLNGTTAGVNSTTDFIELDYIDIFPNATITDANNDDIASMTIVLSGYSLDIYDHYFEFDLRANAENAGVSVGSYNAETKTLSASGNASSAIYESLLASLKYSNSSDYIVSEVMTLTVTVNDGAENGIAINSVTMIPSNDGASAYGTSLDPTFTEGGNAVLVFADMFASTIESGETITDFKFTVTNVSSNAGADEKLSVDGTSITLSDGNSGVTTGNSLNYSVTLSNGTATVTITGANFIDTEFASLLEAVSYQNISDVPGSADRVVTLREVTDSGAQGGIHDNPWETDHAVSTVTVVPVNDPSEFTSGTAVSFSENGTGTAYTISATDVDSNSLTYSLGSANDESLFNIVGDLVTFKNAPDFENPADDGANNTYIIEVQVTGDGLTVNQDVTITVTDVDDTAPTVISVAFPEDGFYKENDDLLFSVEFSEIVILGGSSGSAVIILPSFDGPTAVADYESGSGSSTLVFKHTVQAGEYNPGVFSLGSIEFFSGDRTIKDAAGNDAVYPQSLGSAPNLFVDAILPDFTSAASANYAENGTTEAYTASADEMVTFSLGTSKDEGLFSLANDNKISFSSSPDYETPLDGAEGVDRDNAYVIDVIATDGAGNATTLEVTITVTDLDDTAPTIVSVSRPEEGTYGIGSELNFAVNFSENVILGGSGTATMQVGLSDGPVFNVVFDYVSGSGSSSLLFKYLVASGHNDADGLVIYGNPVIYSFTGNITLQDAAGNTAIMDNVDVTQTSIIIDGKVPTINSGGNASFAENSTDVAYTLTADEAVTFTLGSAKEESLFTLTNGNEISFVDAPDFENPADNNADNAYLIDVIAIDAAGNATTQTVTITVTDIDEIDPVFTSGTEVDFAENGTGAAYIMEATDANALTYSIATVKDYGQFNVSNGVVTFATAPDFENPTDADEDNTYEIDVIATDGLNSVTQTVTITVTDIDEIDPVFTSGTEVDFAENGTGVAYIAITNEPATFTMGSSKDESIFSLDNGHEISFINTPDFEAPLDGTEGVDRDNAYVIDVIATDAAGNVTTRTVIITVTDVAEELTWDGNSWINGVLSAATPGVIIAGDYNTNAHGSLEVNNITINSGVSFTVGADNYLQVNNGLINNGSLLVMSGGSLLTYASGSHQGNDIMVNRNTRYTDGKYSFVGTPVQQSVNNTAADLGNNVYNYDESQSSDMLSVSRWMRPGNSAELVPGVGYTQANQQLIEFTGTPNTGTITYSGSYVNDGWHMVSNPYAAAIFIDDFLDANTNTTDAVYIWDDNGSDQTRGSNSDYIVANKTGATDVSGSNNESRWNDHIGSAQGFFVKLDGSAGDITFTEMMRRSGNNADDNFFRKHNEEKSVVRINLTNESGLFKQALIGWNEDVSDTEISEGYDALMFNLNAEDAIYTIKAELPLTIQTITRFKKQIPLGVNIGLAGQYSITTSVDEYQGNEFYLFDRETGQIVDLMIEDYTFSVEAGQYRDRFILLTEMGILAVETSNNSMYTHNKTLYIVKPIHQLAKYQLFDLSGKQMMEIHTANSEVDLSYLPDGVYLISDGIETKKIILK